MVPGAFLMVVGQKIITDSESPTLNWPEKVYPFVLDDIFAWVVVLDVNHGSACSSDGGGSSMMADSKPPTLICPEKLFSFVLYDIFAWAIILGWEPWF